jgi:hypothetical protein
LPLRLALASVKLLDGYSGSTWHFRGQSTQPLK